MADALAMHFYLLGDGADRWVAEIEIPATGYRDGFRLVDYTDEKEVEGFAAYTAERRWRKHVSDYRTPLTVTRVHIEPAREEA